MLLRTVLAELLVISLLAGVVPARADEPSARQLYNRGRQLEKSGNVAHAYLLYSQAAAADPLKREYWQRAQALQRKAVGSANVMPQGGVGAPAQAAETPLEEATYKDLEEAKKPQPPIEIEGSSEKHDLDLRGNAKKLWEDVTRRYGLDVVFDGDYPEGSPIRLRLAEAEHREALVALMAATGSFFVPISPKLLMVVKDTEQKRREVENTIAVSVPIPEPVTLQDAQEMGRSVQQLMEIQRFAIDSAQRMVLMRDRASKVIPAQQVLQQLLHGRAEIGLEIELVSLPKSTSMSLGLSIPTSFPIRALQESIKLFRGPLTLTMLLGSAELLANMTKSVGRSVFQVDLRATDGIPATFHAGEKYPIVTMSYIGDTSGENVYIPPPTFNFEDLGLSLKITPRIHDRHEVTLEIEAEYKLLGGRSLNGNPVISNRKFNNRVRLRFDEWAMISGLVGRSSTRTLSGPAGLTAIPILGTVFTRRDSRTEEEEAMLVLKPRLLRLPAIETQTRQIWIGSESRLRVPL